MSLPGGKVDNKKTTSAASCNGTGSERLKISITGNGQKLRCFNENLQMRFGVTTEK